MKDIKSIPLDKGEVLRILQLLAKENNVEDKELIKTLKQELTYWSIGR